MNISIKNVEHMSEDMGGTLSNADNQCNKVITTMVIRQLDDPT